MIDKLVKTTNTALPWIQFKTCINWYDWCFVHMWVAQPAVNEILTYNHLYEVLMANMIANSCLHLCFGLHQFPALYLVNAQLCFLANFSCLPIGFGLVVSSKYWKWQAGAAAYKVDESSKSEPNSEVMSRLYKWYFQQHYMCACPG